MNNAPKIRVMHVIGSPDPGGAETFFLRLIAALHDGDVGIEILPVVRADSWVSEQLSKLGIDHRTAPFGGWFDRTTQKILNQCIDGFKPDIIQSWMSRATRFIPQTDIPTVGRLGGYYKLKYYYKNSDYLIGNTKDICKYLIDSGWDKNRVNYIPNFTEPPTIDFKEHKSLARDRYNIPGDAYVILLAGRLHECKGFDLILYALRRLPEHVHALVVGAGIQKPSLEAVVEADGLRDRVHFVEWVSQITPLAAAADVWAVPSRVEPFGNTILDAWAHNIPVVASRAVGPKTLIEHEKTGLLFDIDDADGARSALESLISDKALGEKLSGAGAEKLSAEFSLDTVRQQYLDFYQTIYKEHKNDQTN